MSVNITYAVFDKGHIINFNNKSQYHNNPSTSMEVRELTDVHTQVKSKHLSILLAKLIKMYKQY